MGGTAPYHSLGNLVHLIMLRNVNLKLLSSKLQLKLGYANRQRQYLLRADSASQQRSPRAVIVKFTISCINVAGIDRNQHHLMW